MCSICVTHVDSDVGLYGHLCRHVSSSANMNTYTPHEIVTWLRQQATAFTTAADTIDAAYSDSTVALAASVEARLQQPAATAGSVTIEAIRDLLKRKSLRAGDLAKELNVPKVEIDDLIKAPGSGVVSGKNGWLKLGSG